MGLCYNGEIVLKSTPKVKIVSFSDGTDEEIGAMLQAHYDGKINIADHWHVGDTRLMYLDEMPIATGSDEEHVAQTMPMVIIGINHDTLKEKIGKRTKAAITLQCKCVLSNDGESEEGFIWGRNISTSNNNNYSSNPRRTWLNNTFIGALPTNVQSLVKTVIKKNLANHTDDTAGPDTEDKAFLTSYPEMFGNESYSNYEGSPVLEGEQYQYYMTSSNRIKGNYDYNVDTYTYWLRSPSSRGAAMWCIITDRGEKSFSSSASLRGLAPAFCL